mmetsp:Transcript_108290/g.305283  ORF Transcript_108290/g.305283 Transcript_108290/m.305283 type:complete len:223 (+) Transcript_108290:2855-3523(+)
MSGNSGSPNMTTGTSQSCHLSWMRAWSSLVSTLSGVTQAQSLLSSPARSTTASAMPRSAPASFNRSSIFQVSMARLRTSGTGWLSGAPLSGHPALNVRARSGVPSANVPPQNRSRSRRMASFVRSILFASFLGMSSAMTKTCGHFGNDNCILHHLCNVLKLKSGTFCLSTTATPTASCNVSCGTEKAITAWTRGCAWTTSSTSKGEMISPARFMTSFDRPVM